MADPKFDVLGIGNAIVDVLSHSDDAFLQRHDMPKGTMSLIDDAAAEAIYADMGPGIEASGGSAANTIAGLAAMGGSAAFIGKVRDDQLGTVFTHDIRAAGAAFDTPAAADGLPTARCLILVTPDAQRTMNTFLGASTGLGPEDVDPAKVEAASVTYLEGYLWDPPRAKEAFRKAMEIAKGAGRQVALSLSDPFCVDRYRKEFRELADGPVDILFANEEEIKSLYEVEDFDSALQAVRGKVGVAVLTRSEKGAVVVTAEETHRIEAEPVSKLVDTTGAGDLFAAGFLYGVTQGHDLPTAGRIAAIAAAECISHFGPRPEADLKALLRDRLG
ncbi:adenosine kinase [Marinibaculum pumilum]|uniref:Adenosine kinase n=1 Tax=Marinibaculum pumilum TaxID=1766165 RepID=A0ABV7L694_9PROT